MWFTVKEKNAINVLFIIQVYQYFKWLFMMRGIDKDSIFFEEFSDFTEQLRKRIRKIRKEKKHTQEEMMKFELSVRQFQRIESGNTVNVTLSNLYKISKALDIPLHQLLDIHSRIENKKSE